MSLEKSVVTGPENLLADLRRYRPTAVFVVDLVKHSKRDQTTVMAVQRILQETLREAMASLGLTELHFNHTGDGYVCSFPGDAGSRVLDFISFLHPLLTTRLAPYNQLIRGGIDFGLVHFRSNLLTGGETHFDQPGIRAARLQQGARPGQILCTSLIKEIFDRHYPDLLSCSPVRVKTKDRVLQAFEVTPLRSSEDDIRRDLADFILRRTSREPVSGPILIVDDHPLILEAIHAELAIAFPEREVIEASTGDAALELLRTRTFPLLITDIRMPGLQGYELVQQALEINPKQIAIALTTYSDDQFIQNFFRVGGFLYILKSAVKSELLRAVTYALGPTDDLKAKLAALCDDPIAVWNVVHGLARTMDAIHSYLSGCGTIAGDLLNHKARHILHANLASFGPNGDPVLQLRRLEIQLRYIERLSRIVRRLGVGHVIPFLERLIDGLRLEHEGCTITLASRLGDTEVAIDFGGIAVLLIIELIDNAIAATDGRGHIEVEIAALDAAGEVQFVVKDNGPGVPPDMETSMFEEGTSSNGDGRGMGLHLVRQAVDMLRGSIRYDRSNCSRFCIRLPIASGSVLYIA